MRLPTTRTTTTNHGKQNSSISVIFLYLVVMAAVDNNANTINANAAGDALSVVRDRLFHTLFYKITLLYHRNVPRRWRRIIETMMLSKVS